MARQHAVPVGVFHNDRLVAVFPAVKDAAASLGLGPLAMQRLLNSAEPHVDGRVYVRMKRPTDEEYEPDPLDTLAAAAEVLNAMDVLAYQGVLIRERDNVIRLQASVIRALCATMSAKAF